MIEAINKFNLIRKTLVVINEQTNCHEWTGGLSGSGYGRFYVKKKAYLAHRIAYLIAKGATEDKLVCHTCDNRKCVNPEHLFLGSVKDNYDDMVRKNRGKWHKGERHGNSKITEAQATYILGSNESYVALSKAMNVSYATIYAIRNGIGWRHLKASEV